jgi:hypothetical protein
VKLTPATRTILAVLAMLAALTLTQGAVYWLEHREPAR